MRLYTQDIQIGDEFCRNTMIVPYESSIITHKEEPR